MGRARRVVPALALLVVGACGGDDEDDTPPPPPPTSLAAPVPPGPVAPGVVPAPVAPGVVPAPVAPPGGGVTVVASSTPPGATVTGGGALLGTTPFTAQVPVAAAAPGQVPTFEFTFLLAGHQPVTMRASPVDGIVSVSATLTPASAELPAAEGPLPEAVPAADAAMPFASGQDWRGGYVCGQGPTRLVLRITAVQGTRVEAVFDFHYAPRSVRGSYTLSGDYEPATGRLSLRPGRWINRPPGYEPVGMSGRVGGVDGRVYAGRITGAPSCSAFRVAR